MRVLVQRSKNSKVTINGKVNGKIDKGFMVLIGIAESDTKEIADKMIKKLIGMRVRQMGREEKFNEQIRGNVVCVRFRQEVSSCRHGRPCGRVLQDSRT